MSILLNNKSARHVFLEKHGLCSNPATACTKTDILRTIEKIGFVQVDSIRTVERAHHLILFARHQTYKHAQLHQLLEKDRSLFENWTHDASIIPCRYYPYWKHRFAREKTDIVMRWEKWGREGIREKSVDVLQHLEQCGPTLSRDLKPPKKQSNSPPGWWDWHPSKSALEYLWRTGETAICHRRGFQKAYDIAARIIPPEYLSSNVTTEEFRDWACASALDRLGFATHGEIAAFWNLVTPAIAKTWVENNSANLVEIEIPSFDKKTSKSFWARPNLTNTLREIPPPPSRLRILSPFDPLLRDRKRAEFLFGFDYRIEIFVPEAKRQYGYYVFPILQADRLIGRIDMKADRKAGALNIRNIWLEDKIKWTKSRKSALDSELARLARFSALSTINFAPDAIAN